MVDRPVVSIDENGISAPVYADYLAWLQQETRRIFGADIYIEPDSQDGQLLGIFALSLADVAAQAVATYNSFSPATAIGNGLSSVIKINGLQRLASAQSTVDLTIGGTAGTIISKGVARDAVGNNWILPDVVTIPAGGTVIVTATAQNTGPLAAGIGTVTTIGTPTAGWASVTNASAAVPGRDVETNAALRKRQTLSVAIPSLTVFEGLIGSVAQIDGVTRLKAYENDTDVTDAHSIPPHSISVVVEGGDSLAIAETIYRKKTPGTGTYGGVSQTITDAYGIPLVIKFGRPTQVMIDVEVDITALTGYTSAIGAEIQAAIVAAINDLPIGQAVLYTRLYAPALLTGQYADPSSSAHLTAYELTAVKIALHGGTPTGADIVVAYNEVAVTVAGNVSIVVT